MLPTVKVLLLAAYLLLDEYGVTNKLLLAVFTILASIIPPRRSVKMHTLFYMVVLTPFLPSREQDITFTFKPNIRFAELSVLSPGPIFKGYLPLWFDTTLGQFESRTWASGSCCTSLCNFMSHSPCSDAPLFSTISFLSVAFNS